MSRAGVSDIVERVGSRLLGKIWFGRIPTVFLVDCSAFRDGGRCKTSNEKTGDEKINKKRKDKRKTKR